MGGRHQSLQDLAFLAFTIAQNSVNIHIFLLQLGTQRHTNGDGATLTQRTGGCVNTGNLLAVGMTLQDAVELAEVFKLRRVDEAALSQNGIVAGSTMALAQHKTVTVGVLGVLGVNAHVVEKETGHQFGDGQGAAGMTAVGIGRHVNDMAAHLFTNLGKLCCCHEKPPYT